jgi:hypothetical protein
MKEKTMSAQIIEVLNNICEKFGVAVDWTSKNIQPYLKELMTKCINYKLATDIVWLVVGIILLIIGGVLLRFAYNNNRKYHEIKDYYERMRSCLDDVAGIQFIFGGICLGVAVILILYFTINLITCVTFPEKIILDMVRSYLGNM